MRKRSAPHRITRKVRQPREPGRTRSRSLTHSHTGSRRGAAHAGAHPSAAPKVSVIIPVWNERRTIRAVIRQARRVHPATEVIVVANGTSDGSDRIAGSCGARVITVPYPLGHDVGRALGAMHAKGDILLFLDGDFVIKTEELRPFVAAVEHGIDVALNDYSGPVDKEQVHAVVLAKHAFSALLQQPQLKGTSMTAVPHALSRRALEVIGPERLQVPPLAQATASVAGLVVRPVHFVPVGRRNPLRRSRRSKGVDPLEDLIVGDHVEALAWLCEAAGLRGGSADTFRQRERVR